MDGDLELVLTDTTIASTVPKGSPCHVLEIRKSSDATKLGTIASTFSGSAHSGRMAL
jgi:hypothetical protein